jgi:hypothetical protein
LRPPPEFLSWFGPVRTVAVIANGFGGAVVRARDGYLAAFNPPLGPTLPRRVRARAGVKAFELSKLKQLTLGPVDVPALRTFLESFRDQFRGREVHYERFAEAELERCSDPDTLRATYPVQSRLAAYQRVHDYMGIAVSRVTDR